jgi:hypothetical protein
MDSPDAGDKGLGAGPLIGISTGAAAAAALLIGAIVFMLRSRFVDEYYSSEETEGARIAGAESADDQENEGIVGLEEALSHMTELEDLEWESQTAPLWI